MAEQMMQDAASKAIPAGYKQTEVGVIPEDWDIKELQQICRVPITYGIVQCGPHIVNGVPYIRVSDMTSRELDVDGMLRTSPQIAATFTRSTVDEGDIVYALRGKLGFVRNVPFSVAGANLTQGTARIAPASNVFGKYIFWTLQSPCSLEQATQGAKGSTFVEITLANLKKIKIPVPHNKEEHKVIADSLSDSDELIVGLEQLIAKKQAIKTATMQQLLTGRTRLPQFALRPDGTSKGYKPSELGQIPDDWGVVEFGELFENHLQRQTLQKDELISFVGMQDVSGNGHLISHERLPFNKVKAGLTYFEKGDVLVAKITPCFENGKGCHTETLLTEIGYGSTEFHVLRAKKTADSKFIYYWTMKSSLRITLEAEMVGSAGHRRVPFSALQSYLIPCPVDKNEQSAIATILSDMDNELAALEQKLAKARAIKQGMMQQLLTGRIRLPLPKEA